MPLPEFTQIDTWVFDLDNTLYDPKTHFFDQIEARTVAFVMRELDLGPAAARALCTSYRQECGAVLTGLIDHHDIQPRAFLDEVYRVSLAALKPDTRLAARIRALPGRRVVHTNGTAEHGRRVLQARGLGGVMHAVYGIEDAGLRAKPEPSAFRKIFAREGLDPRRTALFDDEARNLRNPFSWGMRTVLVSDTKVDAPYAAFQTADLSGFLNDVV